jgi:hypothetical protein
MPRCAHGQTETELDQAGVPTCVNCSIAREDSPPPRVTQEQIRARLFQALIDATARSNAAVKMFDDVMITTPSGMPHPDGVQRIKNASREVALSRTELMIAHNRLNDFLSRGTVPEDLKESE